MITILILLSTFLFIVSVLLTIRGFNLVKQNEQLLDIINEMEQKDVDIKYQLDSMLQQMREIDIRGSFESDDEVGSVFKQLKTIIETYNNI